MRRAVGMVGGAACMFGGSGFGRQGGGACFAAIQGWAAVRSSQPAARLLPPRPARRAVFGGTRVRPVVHRLALFDDEHQLTHIISQSDMIK